ncbi:MAG: hypothetical protein RTU63_07120 [Candidatus Thorarchaeota archaeon]
MRMRYAKNLSATFIMLMFILTISYVPPVYLISGESTEDSITSSPLTNVDDDMQLENYQQIVIEDSLISEDDSTGAGTLNPVMVEQSGYTASENLSARTDTYENLEYDLSIDSAHDWIADEVEVSVWNLEKLYAVNGSFNDGFPGTNQNPNVTVDYYPLGWYANSTDDGVYDDELQLAAFDNSTRNFVSVENQGYKDGQDIWSHSTGTKVVWSQVVDNSPYSEDFLFELDYFYLRGPIDDPAGWGITGNCSLALFVDGSVVWDQSLLLLSQRGIWYHTGQIPITILGAPSSFLMEIGLIIDESMTLEKKRDYDGNGVQDGIENAAYISVYMDDISFVKATPPTAEQVQLEFATGGSTSSLTGSLGTYYTSITNSSYWTIGPVPISLTSNTSVSFDYKTRLFSHRFTDSNWEPNIANTGVRYSIERGNSSDLTLYSYVGYLGDYEDPEMRINYPTDWENVTVSDPFLTEWTSSCAIEDTYLIVPSEIIGYLGWWEVRFESPNYAKSIAVQLETAPLVWIEESVYRVGNTTRTQVNIGTETITPSVVDNVNITWLRPDGQEWESESLSGGIAGQVAGAPHILSPGLSPAGEWCVEVYWTNGTEVAYDVAAFEVHHTAEVVGDPAIIETNTGLVITAIVRFIDGDTLDYIVDEFSTISTNWSMTTKYFNANPVNNWWEVTLDTSEIGAGHFAIHVDASRPYYDSASCDINIITTNVTRLSSPNAPWTAGEWGSELTLTFNYEVFNYVADTWFPVTNNSDVSVSFNWTIGHWYVIEDSPGLYFITLDTAALPADTYLLHTIFEKPEHETQELYLTMIMTDADTLLVVPGGDYFDIGLTDVFNTTFAYRTNTNIGIEDASISIVYTGPSGGISWELAEKSDGDYSVAFSAALSGTYVVTIAALKENFQSASDSFFLVVRDITTNFTLMNGSAGIVSYGDDYNIVMSYTNGSGFGLTDANISIESVVPETGISWNTTQQGIPGIYSILLTPEASNTFTVLIQASLLNHQTQFVIFTITATAIASSLTVLNASTAISFDQDYAVYVYYQSEALVGLENANLTIQNPPTEITHTDFEELGEGYYKVTLSPNEIGTFDLVFRAELTGYQSDTAGFALSASRIQTDLRISSGLSSDTIEYLQTSELSVIFERTDFNQTITSADISIQMSPTTGIEWSYHEDSGVYHIEVEPDRVGRWTLTISSSKTGYALGSVQFILDVEPVRIAAELLTPPSAIEGQEFPIEVLLTHEGTSTPVTGALVEFRITASGSPAGNFQPMEETETPGVYHALFTFPLYQSGDDYQLEIQVSKDNFEISGGTFTTPYSKSVDIILQITPIATGSGLFLAILVGSVISLRVFNTRKRRKNLEALQIKKRFDDVSNILGIIALHKKSGLPVYSKMIKGGFEEAMVSAFITAITHFRSEFEMDEKHWEFNVIPISDIISTVPTRSLIVAFITVRPPSKFQEVGMEAFGRATGAMFDELLAEEKSAVVDNEQTKILDTLFYDLLDGYLIERFRTSKEASFPKNMRCLQTAAEQLENGEGFKLEDLAKGMATCGIEESYAYKIVMDAIDEDLIEVAEGEKPDPATGAFIDHRASLLDPDDFTAEE